MLKDSELAGMKIVARGRGYGEHSVDVLDLVARLESAEAALQGMLSIDDSVTQGQERELREQWIPRARAHFDQTKG